MKIKDVILADVARKAEVCLLNVCFLILSGKFSNTKTTLTMVRKFLGVVTILEHFSTRFVFFVYLQNININSSQERHEL